MKTAGKPLEAARREKEKRGEKMYGNPEQGNRRETATAGARKLTARAASRL
jgi:hypothetical protein